MFHEGFQFSGRLLHTFEPPLVHVNMCKVTKYLGTSLWSEARREKTIIYICIYIYIPKSPCSFLQGLRNLQSSNKLHRLHGDFRAPLVLRKHCTCRQIQENGSPRPPKTTQGHPRPPKTTQDHQHHRNRSKTLHLSTNPRKRLSAVTSWRSKTLHLSTNPRKWHSKTLHLSTNPRKQHSKTLGAQIGCCGATGRSNRLLRGHWALQITALERSKSLSSVLSSDLVLESAAAESLGARKGCSKPAAEALSASKKVL